MRHDHDRFDRFAVRLGSAGAAILLCMDAFATWDLSAGPPYADADLVVIGIAVGVASSAIYFRLARRLKAVAASPAGFAG